MVNQRIGLGLLAVLLFGALMGRAQPVDSDAALNWLLVVQGAVTSVTDAEMTLTVPHAAIAFTDRPARQVRLIDLAAFAADAWAEGSELHAAPPNASVVDETKGRLAVIIITGMSYAGGALTIQFKELAGRPPSTGDRIAITIDAFPTPVNGQITDS